MRLERNSLIAVLLLVLAGCSASRHARQADNDFDTTDSVATPLRHADEYDSRGRNYEYEYESAPSEDETPGPDRTPVPPPVPMHEPVPAPPAIGVSRIKSVSWLRFPGSKSEQDNCGDNACGDNECGDGCSTGQQTILPPEYFTEGCVTPPRTATVPSTRCREKTTLLEVMHGWNMRAKTRRPERVQPSLNCGEPTACDPGLITPEGCNSASKSRRSAPVVKRHVGGAPVAPGTAPHGKHGSSPDNLLDPPATLEAPADEQKPQVIPDVPVTQPLPVLPESAPTPANQNPAPAPVVPQQTEPDTVKQIVRPPMWPRLGSAAATPNKVPVSNPANSHDSSLPMIQPGRRI
ncbi:MAG: hypothetical protein H7Z17_13220 [Fuerstia sp.]|nr:hypothetical protein [Fuerstiella sp.]